MIYFQFIHIPALRSCLSSMGSQKIVLEDDDSPKVSVTPKEASTNDGSIVKSTLEAKRNKWTCEVNL